MIPWKRNSTGQLLARIEAGRRRVAEAKEHGEWSGSVDDSEGENLAGLSMIEILHRGRERVARAKAEREEADSASGLARFRSPAGSCDRLDRLRPRAFVGDFSFL